MKILHFADLHLGMENYGRIDVATGLHSRLVDFLHSFDELVDFAIGEDVDLVLFAGDAYRTRDPSPTQQREFAARIRRLREARIPVFMLIGNHDLPNATGRANAIEIFDTLAVEGVQVAKYPRVHRLDTRKGPLQIVALPWVLRSVLMSKDEYKNLSLPDLNNLMLDKVSRVLEDLISELEPHVPAVLAAHGTVQGATYGSERSVMLGSDLVLPPSLIAHPRFAYVALGHIHKHQVLNDQPPVIYSGSLDRIDFGEEHDDKGFVLVELEKGKAPWRFVKLNGRRFITIRVEATSDEPTLDVLAEIGKHDLEAAIVRVFIRTTLEKAGLLRDAEIRQALRSAWYVSGINKEIQQTDRVRLGARGGVEGLTPREALQRYFEEKRVTAERAQLLLERADKLFLAETA
jgi:exonuclease SbcD